MKAVLRGWRDLAPGVRQFDFEVERSGFHFLPGQFVSVNVVIDGNAITRAYSIASPPNGNKFSLCLNRVEGGRVSPLLFGLEAGAEIDISAPLGFFVMRPAPADSVFIATGTGVAPMRAMLPSAVAQNPGKQFALLFGTRTPESLLYRDEFEALARKHSNFRFSPTLSRADAGWPGLRGHVQNHLEGVLAGNTRFDVYICGLRAMVDDVRTRLKALGFDRKQIISERYD